MAASAGTVVFQTGKGKVISVDIYIPDATGTNVTWNSTGLAAATSPEQFRVPMDCILTDITTATAPTAVGGTLSRDSGVINGATYRYADRLNTLSKRAAFAIPFRKGEFVSILQH